MIEILLLVLGYTICIPMDNQNVTDIVVEAGNDWSSKINTSDITNDRYSDFYMKRIKFEYKNTDEKTCDINIITTKYSNSYGEYSDENNTIRISSYLVGDKLIKIPDNVKKVVARHEIGHWLGAKHTTMIDDITGYEQLKTMTIMQPILRINNTDGITVTEYDVNHVVPKLFKNPNAKSFHAEWKRE